MDRWLLWIIIGSTVIVNVGQEARIGKLERVIAEADTACTDKGDEK